MAKLSMDDLREFAAYLSLLQGSDKAESELTVEEKLIKTLGKPD